MELITYDVELPRDFHGKPFVVAPIGDIQWAGVDGPTARDTLRRSIDRGMALGATFLGFGDYIDFCSPSNRQRLTGAALYDTAEDVISDKARELVHELMAEHLKPTRDRWAGLLEGHHYLRLKTGDTTDQLLAQLLNTRFLGTCGVVRWAFHRAGHPKGQPCATFSIWCHHGVGGGQTVAAALNKLERTANAWGGIDVVAMGHTTKQSTAPISRVYVDWSERAKLKLEHREIRLVNTGGFCKSYVEGSTSGRTPRGHYPEVGMMSPAALGSPIIRAFPWLVKDGKRERVEITVTVEV